MRLIDADALKLTHCKECDAYPDNCPGEDECYEHAIWHLDLVDTIDAEPVLHCKDCKYWHNGVNITYCYRIGSAMIKENDYCSFGERKEE